MPTNRITQILNGKRAITADTALRLGQWFGTGPELWLNLQQSYELRLAKHQIGQEIQTLITHAYKPRRCLESVFSCLCSPIHQSNFHRQHLALHLQLLSLFNAPALRAITLSAIAI